MENVTVLDHPLLKHKISILRDKKTGTNEFRSIVGEIAMLMGYEALRDLPTKDVEVETPIEECMAPVIYGRKMAIVPVLRAGLGMVSGILSLVPAVKVGHIRRKGNRCSRSHAGNRGIGCGCCQSDQGKGR